jgi:hypothetical protein
MAKQSGKQTRIASKIRPVNIAHMRVPQALVTQRQFRPAHGNYLAANLDLNKLGFPVLNHRDGVYWILDGQHRIYALKENGFGSDNLDCEVYESLSDQEMADIFLGRGASKAISPYDKFHVACTAGYSREASVRRAVEANGLRVSQKREDDTIGAVGALCKVYDRAGANHTAEVIVGQVVRTLKNAYAGDPAAFDRSVIEGLGLIYNRYNGKTNEKELAARLATVQHGVRGLMRRAETARIKTGNSKAQCVAATIVEVYNRGLGPRAADRLPDWWKAGELEKG